MFVVLFICTKMNRSVRSVLYNFIVDVRNQFLLRNLESFILRFTTYVYAYMLYIVGYF